MLFIALSTAGLLLAFSAFAAFGLPWLVMGNRAFEEFPERRDQQMMAGVLGTAAVALACLPLLNAALISAGPQLQVFAETVLGVPERFWS
ncbi:hypothetical protein HNE_3532 [Hyphomonas neptunium ATCC 15444]|uniref:Uncharacterized protein n=2 Tax=Hyphomonas TaxID=85 RepID=Q0BWE0_HYPNA|nr:MULTISPECIES: hypothetical protein [Hyphomonas]ABI78642.1 hypothetical protein HNE_3532 [Hyphomonas neptunium ATCC 15444]KCZ94778.1 hypothetical protein HHI_08288 [Hyphomonas hirschiana VP5]